MVCDVCGKKNATVHLTEIVDDQMSELHLCEECAKKKSQQMESQFGLADLLAGLADFGKPIEAKESVKLKCATCGITYDTFIKMGRLGCSDCYTSFQKYLAPLLKKIHGTSKHVGKSPCFMQTDKQCQDLSAIRDKLQQAIDREEFEEAARLRDQIKNLQTKNRSNAHKKEKPGDAV